LEIKTSFFSSKEYDLMTNSVPTPSRAAIVEYSHTIAFIDVSYIIPYFLWLLKTIVISNSEQFKAL